MNLLLLIIGKAIIYFSRLFNIGNGGTWPGEIALRLKPDILTEYLGKIKKRIIIVSGTNGKTTTAKLIREIVKGSANTIHNDSGANLLNGLVSAFIQVLPLTGKLVSDFAVFEVDENILPLILDRLRKMRADSKTTVVLLNLFRDQLDRYGEVDIIASKWQKALSGLSEDALVILNADDPQIAYLANGIKSQIKYFGIDRPYKFLKIREHATDSTFCRRCGSKLNYRGIYFSHLGIWSCPSCGNRRPKTKKIDLKSQLTGLYNEYNTMAAYLIGKSLNFEEDRIKKAINNISPAFGRQEEIKYKGKIIKIFLSKNPAGFNASLRTVIDFKPESILLLLNDRIPDGRDVSWIWDVDFEMIHESVNVICSGDRAYDMGLRIKYTMQQYNNITIKQLRIYENIKDAINSGIKTLKNGKTLYILATYSAMLEARKVLTGRKIL